MKKDIAIVILNYIQYINIKPGIDRLLELGYSVDIISPIDNENDTSGFHEMFKNINGFLKEKQYNVYDKEPDFEYKILLEPYPYVKLKSKYKIRYRYGVLSAKPNKVYLPENYLTYDAILCSGSYDANYLSVFSKTYITGNMKYINFHKKKHEGKPILLYLPTYGEESSIDSIASYLNKLRKNFYIIAKVHHGTSFLKNEIYRFELLKNNVDKLYDQYMDLSSLLKTTDVVLTDNSGSIFEALYVKIPVAIFADNVNQNKLLGFDTIQSELVNAGIIPYSNEPKDLEKIINKALSKQTYDLQKEWSKTNLYHPKDLVKDFIKVIINFMNDDIDLRYYEMHKILKENYYNNLAIIAAMNDKNYIQEVTTKELQIQNDKLIKEKESLLKEKESLLKQLNYYKTGQLYKIAHKLYEIKNGGKNEK